MEYIKKAEEEIKNRWFKDHAAEIQGEEGMQVLHWRKKGTSMYYTKYILSGSTLVVTGDIGEAIFSLTCAATLKNLKDFDLHYLMRKMSASSDERWNFDDKLARKELKEWYEDTKENGVDDEDSFNNLYHELMDATSNWSMQRHFETAVFSIYEHTSVDWFDGEEASMVAGFGKRLPYRFIAYWVGLRMAIEQLEKGV